MTRSDSVFLSTNRWAKTFAIPLTSFDSISSTNDLAKQKAFDHPQMVYLAKHQTQGRGQAQKIWEDTGEGQSLCVSFQFLIAQPPQPVISPLIGFAVYEALSSVFKDFEFSIKPPNDLFLKNKKIAGLLIESVAKGHEYSIIIGFGLNVFSAPKNIDQAGSLLLSNEAFDELQWFKFLNLLFSSLVKIVDNGAHYLSPFKKQKFLRALNAFPLNSKTYTDFTPTCHLETSEGQVSWKDFSADVTDLHTP